MHSLLCASQLTHQEHIQMDIEKTLRAKYYERNESNVMSPWRQEYSPLCRCGQTGLEEEMQHEPGLMKVSEVMANEESRKAQFGWKIFFRKTCGCTSL